MCCSYGINELVRKMSQRPVLICNRYLFDSNLANAQSYCIFLDKVSRLRLVKKLLQQHQRPVVVPVSIRMRKTIADGIAFGNVRQRRRSTISPFLRTARCLRQQVVTIDWSKFGSKINNVSFFCCAV